MATKRSFKQSEVERNYDAFQRKLAELLSLHAGKFALMHDGEVSDFFDSAGDAYKFGLKAYGAGKFSIQEVTDSAVDLGFFTHALVERSV